MVWKKLYATQGICPLWEYGDGNFFGLSAMYTRMLLYVSLWLLYKICSYWLVLAMQLHTIWAWLEALILQGRKGIHSLVDKK